MALSREAKADVVDKLRDSFHNHPMVIVTHYSGMSVEEITDLRQALREGGATYTVTKNRLAKIALEGSEYESIADMLVGPTGVCFSNDPVATAKAVTKYAKDNEKLTIIGGGLGPQRLDASQVEELTKMPSIEELRGKIVGMLVTPATRLVVISGKPATQLATVLQAPARDLVGVMAAQGAKQAA